MPLQGFPPIARRASRVLVLGSMPGQASLEAHQYYAHPRNAFWPIMADLFGFDPDASYRTRVARLRRAGVAVWDVVARCDRPGSLDADIVEASIVPNDFAAFFAAHPRIRTVLFNGAKAEQAFRRYVADELVASPTWTTARLPSTSPAHAAMRPVEKRRRWRRAIRAALDG